MGSVPRVSVVIPTWTGGPLLTSAIESALSQSFEDLEVIVCADGWSADAEARARAFGERVRFLAIDHTGRPGAPRNRAVSEARADLIAFLDDDDLWERDKLRTQVARMDRAPELDATYTDRTVVYADGSRQSAESPDPDAGGSLLDEVLSGLFPQCCTLLVRRGALARAGGFDETLVTAEDFALWLRLARFARVARVAEALTLIRRRAGSLSDRSGPAAYGNGIAVLERELAARDLSSRRRLRCRRTLALFQARLALALAAQRDRPAARRAALHGVASFPASRTAWRAMGRVFFGGASA